jgi:FAD synthase
MQIEFVERLRSERRFDNAEALREQLLQDAKKAKTINNNQ